mmetsp:Transcript_10464/g.29592  ORF Transcript_10464/g.29592 Transcript_10464/m.29592 type:complete len:294 (-) Transcript_10464:134-1015(-)
MAAVAVLSGSLSENEVVTRQTGEGSSRVRRQRRASYSFSGTTGFPACDCSLRYWRQCELRRSQAMGAMMAAVARPTAAVIGTQWLVPRVAAWCAPAARAAWPASLMPAGASSKERMAWAEAAVDVSVVPAALAVVVVVDVLLAWAARSAADVLAPSAAPDPPASPVARGAVVGLAVVGDGADASSTASPLMIVFPAFSPVHVPSPHGGLSIHAIPEAFSPQYVMRMAIPSLSTLVIPSRYFPLQVVLLWSSTTSCSPCWSTVTRLTSFPPFSTKAAFTVKGCLVSISKSGPGP